MTRVVEWAVRNTRLVLAMVVVVLIAGTIAFIRIPKESQPDIPFPMMMVQVSYPGISPEDSARLLVKPLERYLRSVEGLKTTTARAYQGFAIVLLEFDVNFNKQKALEDVRAQVDEARSRLPQAADPPIVQEFNSSQFPVIEATLSGNVPERTLTRLARDLSDDLKTIPSVLGADLNGNRQEQLEIVIDPAKLESYGISQAEMYNAISQNNSLIPAGSLDTGHGSFAIKVPAVIEKGEDVLNLPIRSTPNATVTLKDVAQVRRNFFDATSFARMNGQPTIAIEITKRIGANIIATNQLVRDTVTAASKSWPPGVHVDYTFDESTYIRSSLSSLSDSIILAIVLVMIIIVAALGPRSGMLVGIAIPTSFLMAFMILNGLGMTLNEMIMFGLLLAVGILVDGAIIVVEYADRKMTEGHKPKQAFAEAALRMFWPVVAATLTMIGTFLPMLLWPGIPGKFMSYFPITLIIVLSSSMIVALIFLPVLGGMLNQALAAIGVKPPRVDPQHEKAIEASETGDWRDIPGITGWYARLSERLTRSPGKVLLGAVGVVFGVIFLFAVTAKGVEFFVDQEPDFFNVLVSARGNLSADEKRDLVMGVERIVASVKGIKSIFAVSGGQAQANNREGGVPVDNIGHVTVELKDYRERRKAQLIMDEISKKTANLAGVHVEVRKPSNGPPVGKDVMIDVSSDNPASLQAVTAAIRNHMDSLPELRDVEDTRPLPGIEWNVDINREMANRFGVSTQSIGTAIQLVTNGILVGKYRPDDSQDEVDIRVRYPRSDRGIRALDDLRVSTNNQQMVPISNFVTLRPVQKTDTVERVDGHRVYHVRANIEKNRANPPLPSAEVAKVKQWLAMQSCARHLQRRRRGAERVRRLPLGGCVPGAVPYRNRSFGAIQQFLPHVPDPGRGRVGDDRRAARHGRDGTDILGDHDRDRHDGSCGHRGEPQHRAHRYLPSPSRFGHGPDRGRHTLERATPAAGFSHHHHRDRRASADDVRGGNQFLDPRGNNRGAKRFDVGAAVDGNCLRTGLLEDDYARSGTGNACLALSGARDRTQVRRGRHLGHRRGCATGPKATRLGSGCAARGVSALPTPPLQEGWAATLPARRFLALHRDIGGD
jgi:multidrug efflux pump